MKLILIICVLPYSLGQYLCSRGKTANLCCENSGYGPQCGAASECTGGTGQLATTCVPTGTLHDCTGTLTAKALSE